MTEKEMQLIIGKHIGIKNICIPNVLLVGQYRPEDLYKIKKMKPWVKPSKMYEADLVYITKSKYLIEIEIKVNMNDFRNDFKKKIYHSSPLVNALYYAIPSSIYKKNEREILELTEDKAGIILIISKHVISFKHLAPSRKSIPLTDSEIKNFMRIGCMKWFREW